MNTIMDEDTAEEVKEEETDDESSDEETPGTIEEETN